MGITPWRRYSIILFNELDDDFDVASLPEFASEARPVYCAATAQSSHVADELRCAKVIRLFGREFLKRRTVR